MKTVRFDFTLDKAHAERREWCDGEGGAHKSGDVVSLPDHLADLAVSTNAAVFVEPLSRLEAVKAAEERAERNRIAEQKARADNAMAFHDSMPEDVRALVNVHGRCKMTPCAFFIPCL